jgi:hypothetical protein
VKGIVLIAVGFVVGCAQAGKQDNSRGGSETVDSGNGGTIYMDAPAAQQHHDAGMGSGSGSGSCTPMQIEMLQNPAFDLAPVGTMWNQTPIDPAYPLVTADTNTGIPNAQSTPYRAWLGGFVAASGKTDTDSMYQDVAIPATATALVMTGYYYTATSEMGGAFDTGTFDLRQTNGTPIETIQAVDSAHPTGAWTAINHTFTTAHAGETVRVYFTSSNDDSLVTSFLFDTLSLEATACP